MPHGVTICPCVTDCEQIRTYNVPAGNNTWPAANRALYLPFVVVETITAVKLFVYNSITATGNVDAGLYTEDGTRLVSIGGVAMSGTVTLQEFDITDTVLAPGRYYMGLAFSSASANLKASTGSGSKMLGIMEEAAAYPLPATATFAAASSDYTPFCGLTTRSTL
jgi:hypothetical protein